MDATEIIAEITRQARAAGARGADYQEFASSDSLFDLVGQLDASGARFDTDVFEAAFCEGRREWRVERGGWRTIWTTAPKDYDWFGTEEVEVAGLWHGKTLRRVIAEPSRADCQEDRYSSGCHYAKCDDPRVVERRIADQLAAEKAEKAARETRRAAGLQWLAALGDEVLADEALGTGDAMDAEVHARCLTWSDLEAEKRDRREKREAAERAVAWARCCALVPAGATLIDDGAPSRVTYIGATPYRTPGRDPRVWHAVRLEQGWPRDDAEQAVVVGEGNDVLGALATVADRIEKGELRVARPDEHVPPRAAIQRIGAEDWAKILRVVVDDRTVWVGRPRFTWDPRVVDEHGHLVRPGRVRQAAEAALRARDFGGAAAGFS